MMPPIALMINAIVKPYCLSKVPLPLGEGRGEGLGQRKLLDIFSLPTQALSLTLSQKGEGTFLLRTSLERNTLQFLPTELRCVSSSKTRRIQ